jgi:hypothetical protein
MSADKLIIKIYSITNLMVFILHLEVLRLEQQGLYVGPHPLKLPR